MKRKSKYQKVTFETFTIHGQVLNEFLDILSERYWIDTSQQLAKHKGIWKYMFKY